MEGQMQVRDGGGRYSNRFEVQASKGCSARARRG
jgi:hypothetical protein